MRILTVADTKSLLTFEEAFRAVEDAYRVYGRERSVLADPAAALMIMSGDTPSIFVAKGAMSTSMEVCGIRFGEQFGHKHCIVADARTSEMRGVVEETWLCQWRVGLSAAVTAKHLAPPDVGTIALIGAGKRNVQVYRCLAELYPEAAFRVASRTFEGAQRFASRLEHNAISRLCAVPSATEAVAGADIVVSITLASQPMILPGMLAPGSLMLSMGGVEEVAFATLTEIDRVVVDDLGYALLRGDFAAWIRRGDIEREELIARVDADIGEAVIGVQPFRASAHERILAVIQGMAICDLALSKLCLDRAEEAGVGTVIADYPSAIESERDREGSRIRFVVDGLKEAARSRMKT